MKISAEDVIFTAKNGKEATLVEILHGVLEALGSLKAESSDAEYMQLYDAHGEGKPVADVLWHILEKIEQYEMLLNVKINKPH